MDPLQKLCLKKIWDFDQKVLFSSYLLQTLIFNNDDVFTGLSITAYVSKVAQSFL